MRSAVLGVAGVFVVLGVGACGGGATQPQAAPTPNTGWQQTEVCSLVSAGDTAQLFPGKQVETKEANDAQKRECTWHPQGLDYENLDVRVWRPLSQEAIAGSAKRTLTIGGRQAYVARESSYRCELNVDMSGYALGITRQSYSPVTCDAVLPLAGTIVEHAQK
jgi:hypothetical protein